MYKTIIKYKILKILKNAEYEDIDKYKIKLENLVNALDKICIIREQFYLINRRDKGLLGEFIFRWENFGKMNKIFCNEWIRIISSSIDSLITL